MGERYGERSGECGSGECGAGRATVGRVLIVANHRTMRLALRQALEAAGLGVCGDAPLGREAVVAALGVHPNVVLVDVANDEPAGVETCRQFRRAAIATLLVALAPRVGSGGHAARAAGVNGVVSTDVSVTDLARFLAEVGDRQAGRRRHPSAPPAHEERLLTRREQEVLSLAAGGLTDGQISRALYISYKTVKNHLHHVYGKLGARGRTEAVTVGLRQGLITL